MFHSVDWIQARIQSKWIWMLTGTSSGETIPKSHVKSWFHNNPVFIKIQNFNHLVEMISPSFFSSNHPIAPPKTPRIPKIKSTPIATIAYINDACRENWPASPGHTPVRSGDLRGRRRPWPGITSCCSVPDRLAGLRSGSAYLRCVRGGGALGAFVGPGPGAGGNTLKRGVEF